MKTNPAKTKAAKKPKQVKIELHVGSQRSALPAATIANVSLRDQQQRGWKPLNPARLLRFYDSSC
jgi:hypothetical protein